MKDRYYRIEKGLLERITGSTGFTIVFALSVAIVAPTLLAGVLGTPILIAAGKPADWVPAAMLVGGGFVGAVGWFRSPRHDHEMWHGRIEATLAFLAIGVGAALGGIAALGYATLMDVESWSPSAIPWYMAIFVAAHAVVILRALGWMRRLPREYTNRTGIRFDSLPVTFLVLGIALVAAVALITTWI